MARTKGSLNKKTLKLIKIAFEKLIKNADPKPNKEGTK